MRCRRVISIILTFLLLIGSCGFSSLAVADTEAPLVTSYRADKTQYNHKEKISITIDIEEDGTGVTDIYFGFSGWKSATMAQGYTFSKHFDKAIYSGTYTFTFLNVDNFNEPLPEGRYTLDNIQINDSAGNTRQYIGYHNGTDEEGNEYIKDWLDEQICYVPDGVGFNVGETSAASIFVKTFSFDAAGVKKGASIPVSLQLEGGKTGANYTAYLHLENASHVISTDVATFKYAANVRFNVPIPEAVACGKYRIYTLEIKPSARKDYKTYSNYYTHEDVIANSDDDQCQILGNNYFYVYPASDDEKMPMISSIDLSPSSLTKPGFVSGKINIDLPVNNMRQLDVVMTGNEKGEFKITIDSFNRGKFLVSLGTSAPADDYYITEITLWDKYDNSWRYYSYPYFDDEGRQYFVAVNELGEDVTVTPEFTNAKCVTAEDEFDVGFHSSLSDPHLTEKIASLQSGETGRVEINGDFIATAGLFEALAGKDASVMFACDNYQWIFNGMDITEPKDVDLHINFKRVDGDEYTSEGDALMISFPENGTLPGKANIRIKSDYTYKMYKLHNGIYLYYFNDTENNLEFEDDSCIRAFLDDSDSWCSFEITHNSRFLAAASKLKETSVPLAKGRTFKSGAFTYKVIKGRRLAITKVKSKAIKSVVIPGTVKHKNVTYKVGAINASLFANCKKLTSVTIGKNVSSIGKKVFYNCPKLKKVTIRTTLLKKSTVGLSAFAKINSRAVVKVPGKVFKTYKTMLKARGLTGKKQAVRK
jgi:hypothetical protein